MTETKKRNRRKKRARDKRGLIFDNPPRLFTSDDIEKAHGDEDDIHVSPVDAEMIDVRKEARRPRLESFSQFLVNRYSDEDHLDKPLDEDIVV